MTTEWDKHSKLKWGEFWGGRDEGELVLVVKDKLGDGLEGERELRWLEELTWGVWKRL